MANLDDFGPVVRVPNTKIWYYPTTDMGSGATAIVYRGYIDDETVEAAVKKIKAQPELQNIYENELKVNKRLLKNTTDPASTKIVKILDWTTLCSTSHYFIAMKLANCNLREYLTSNPNLGIDERKKLCLDMAEGLKFLHDNNVLHRDLKPENVLIYTDRKTTVAKLSDFGISRIIDPTTASRTTVGCGAEIWMAPEAITSMHRGKQFKNVPSMDVFVLGMVMHFTMTFENPFKTSKRYGNNPSRNIEEPDIDPQALNDKTMFTEQHLLFWMMQKDHKKRPELKNVLSHPMFWSPKKSLEFVVNVAFALDGKEQQHKGNDMKIAYQKFRKNLSMLPFNLHDSIDDRLFKRKHDNANFCQRYKNHINDLIKLIRDKYVHYKDIVPEVFDEHFATVSKDICKEKYIQYFMKAFPDMLIFLFCYIVNNEPDFKSIKHELFPDYTVSCLLNQPTYEKFMKGSSLPSIGVKSPNIPGFSQHRERLVDPIPFKSYDEARHRDDLIKPGSSLVLQVGSTEMFYYPREKILGQGNASIVYKGYFGDKQILAAIKQVEKDNNKLIHKELDAFVTLMRDNMGHHPNVLKLFMWTEHNNMLYFAMEQASCNLRKLIEKNPTLHATTMVKISFDAVLGLQFLHHKKILHGNLKPENVLIFEKNDKLLAKLADVGVSRKMKKVSSISLKSTKTETWMSPEALLASLNEKPFRNQKACDIFSLGMTIYFIFSNGNYPFDIEIHENGSFRMSRHYIWPIKSIPARCSKSTFKLLSWMMERAPEERPSIYQVIGNSIWTE